MLRRRRYGAVALGVCLALGIAAVAVLRYTDHGDPQARAYRLSERRVARLAAALKQAASEPSRPIYKFSVIDGGVFSAAELGAAIKRDPVVAAHYKQVSLDRVRAEQVTEPRFAYVSYRMNDQVYWTKNKVRLDPGETILTDGETQVRARCGNCISFERLGPTSPDEPAAIELDALLPESERPGQDLAPLIAAFRMFPPTVAGGPGAGSPPPGSGTPVATMAGGIPGAGGVGGGPVLEGRSAMGGAGVPRSLAAVAPGLRSGGTNNGVSNPGLPGGGSPGNSGDAPGNSGGGPGNSGGSPGNSGGSPGNSGGAPGNSGGSPGNSGGAPGGGSPGEGTPGGGSSGGGSGGGTNPPGLTSGGGSGGGSNGGGSNGGGSNGGPTTIVPPGENDPDLVLPIGDGDGDGGGGEDGVAVPEPATLLLLGAGLAGAALRRRRRR